MAVRIPPALTLALFFALSGAATASSTEDAARQAAKKGAAAYNLGSYEEAAGYYEESYRLVQDPVLLFNIGQSWRLAGRPDKALTAYKSYLRTAPPNASQRDQASRRVVDLERLLAERKSPPPAPVLTLPPPREARPSPIVVSAPAAAAEPSPPVYRRWWFWTGLVAVAAGAAAVGVALSREGGRQTSCGDGVDFCTSVRR
jgi:tetratricopeptide (TPR) repeat protein